MRAVLLSLLVLTTNVFAADYPGAPASVTAAYIEADGNGLALDGETAAKLLSYTTWPEAPGWDSFTVIKSYQIGEVGWTGDKATVAITYEVAGQVAGLTFVAKAAKEEVSFNLVKKKGKWKIVSPQLPPHLFVAEAITALETIGAKDDPAGKAALKKLQSLE